MVIVYYGGIASLARELREVEPVLNQRYGELLGAERSARVREVATRTLRSSSFFDRAEAVRKRLGIPFADEECNKLSIATAHELNLDANGNPTERKVSTAPIFYISEEGFRHSHSADFTERPVASYIHEFDHFVWYALQRVPLYTVNLFLIKALESRSNPINPTEYMTQLMEFDLQPREKARKMYFAQAAHLLTEMYEKANRILDRAVMESIGITVPIPWRGEPRQYMQIAVSTGQVLIFPFGGDPFKTLEDREVIERVLRWEHTANLQISDPWLVNLIEGVKNLRVSRVSLDELIQLSDRRGRRRR